MRIFQKESLKKAINFLQARFHSPGKPSAEFVRWCKKATGTLANARQYVLSNYVGNLNDINKALESMVKDVNAAIQSGTANYVNFNQGINIGQEILFAGRPKNELTTDIAHLTISSVGLGSIRLEHLVIELMQIFSSPCTLDLVNCQIGKVEIAGPGVQLRLTSTNTSVGLLILRPQCVHHLDVAGGCILNFDCPAPGSDNPFTGHATFTDVFLPKDTKNYLLESAQPYRNMRHHLRSLHNTNAAGLFHDRELIVERERSPWTDNLVSRVYEYISEFGNSILRPFLWWLLLIVVMIWLALHHEGGLVAADPTTAHVGWPTQYDLFADNGFGPLKRAAYASLTA